MASTKPNSKSTRTVLLVEADVIVRFGLAQHLRSCGHTVIEVVSAAEARAVLVAGPAPDILLSDAQLAGDDNGFALAQWVRRHRKGMEVILTGTLRHKAQAAAELCAGGDNAKALKDGQALLARIQAMMAERKRRMRPAPKTAPAVAPKRRRS